MNTTPEQAAKAVEAITHAATTGPVPDHEAIAKAIGTASELVLYLERAAFEIEAVSKAVCEAVDTCGNHNKWSLVTADATTLAGIASGLAATQQAKLEELTGLLNTLAAHVLEGPEHSPAAY